MTPLQSFAESFGIKLGQAKHLLNLVDKAADAQTKEMNEGISADKECKKVNDYAKYLGFTKIDWNPGIYPLFYKGEKSRHITD